LNEIRNAVGLRGCEWDLNPPHSSHFGGIWERAIRSIRSVLDVSLLICGKRTPSRDEFHTFLQEAATIVNNTPMCSVSEDPNDPLPLTPAKLLTLKGDPNPPSLHTYSEKDILAYGPKRWRRVQAISECFWNRWRTEFLQQLQIRQKWNKVKPNLQTGDVVLLKVKNARRNTWPLALVQRVKTSNDGNVRSATLRLPSTSSSGVKLFDRPISEIVPLIMNSGATSSE